LPVKVGEKLGKEVTVISTDDFYRSNTKFLTSAEINFDFNSAEKTIEKDLLLKKVKELMSGKDVLVPPERSSEDKEEK